MQTSPYHPAFVAYQGGGLGDLGALGLDPTAAKGTAAVASYGAGAAATAGAGALGAAGYASIGSVAGPIGAVVGLVVGIVITKLLTKNYLNVGQMNAAEAAEISAFNQYRTIAGRAPGRQFGLAAMRAVWKGALHSGYFPRNQALQCFHDGCSAHPGNASLIDMVLDGGCSDRNCFPDLLPQFLARVQSPAMMRAQPVTVRMGFAPRPGGTRTTVQIAGFGALGLVPMRPMPMTPPPAASFPGTPEAVIFIDSFFIPANSSGAPCGGSPQDCYWAAPQNALEHQILYDTADAYLAQQSFPSTPFVAVQAAVTSQQAPARVLPAASTPYPPTDPGWLSTTAKKTCTPYPPGSLVPMIACMTMKDPVTGAIVQTGPCQEGGCGIYPATSRINPVLNPLVTPLLPVTPPAVAVGSGVVTTVNAASNANLDAALASQGLTRVATSQDGYPVYQTQSGATYAYANGQLYAYGSAAQLAVTGSAGTGIATPAGGLDPATAQLIANMLSQGATPAQASQAAASKLQARGVPVTPDVQAQLDATAVNPPAPATASPLLLMLGAGVLAFVLVRPSRRASNKGPLQ